MILADLGWAALFYCGTPLAFHIIILADPRVSTNVVYITQPLLWFMNRFDSTC